MTTGEMKQLIAQTHLNIARKASEKKMSDKELMYFYVSLANSLLGSCESWAREEFLESIEEN